MPGSTAQLGLSVHKALTRLKAQALGPLSFKAAIPSAELLTKLFDIVYYTTLKTEEGRPVVCRLCVVNPRRPDENPPPAPRPSRWTILPLANRLPLTVATVVKIAKAADPWSSALAVYYDAGGNFFIWGLIDQTVHWSRMLVREGNGYPPPGLINVVSNGIADISVYREWGFLARLQQDTIVEKQNDVFWYGPVGKRLDSWVLPFVSRVRKRVTPRVFDREPFWAATLKDMWIGSLCRILISVQRYRHGGAILLTNSSDELFPHYQVSYDRLPRHLEELAVARIRWRQAWMALNEIIDEGTSRAIPIGGYFEERIAQHDSDDLEESLTGTVHFISSLSCVDGLVLMRPNLTVNGYGVEIRTPGEMEKVRVSLTPDPRTKSRIIEANHFGTRHRSMMRYCYAHPNSLGFVVSQDGDIRAVMRARDEITLWDNLKVHLLWSEDWFKHAGLLPKQRKGRR